MCHQLLPQWHKSLQLQKAFWLHICKSTNSFSHCWQKKNLLLKQQTRISSVSNIDREKQRRRKSFVWHKAQRRRPPVCFCVCVCLLIEMVICLLKDSLTHKRIPDTQHYLTSLPQSCLVIWQRRFSSRETVESCAVAKGWGTQTGLSGPSVSEDWNVWVLKLQWNFF